jgi:SAM-dependent methyltransferase
MEGAGDAATFHDRCLVCGSARLLALEGYEEAYLVRCGECTMVFSARVPTDEELQAHYRDYGHAWQDSPITRQRYAELLRSFQPYRSTNRILDFGCGAGYFLEAARDHGWDAYGIEYSGRALELARAKQLNVVEAPLPPDAFGGASFDVVTAFEVFEHVREPRREGSLIASRLRPGGLLYCTTPNFNSLSRRLLGARWSIIEYPEHLCYFTGPSLARWLSGHGFVVESIKSSGISLARLREATSSSDAGAPAAGDEHLRETIEGSRLLRASKYAVNAGMSRVGIGDTLKGRLRLSARASARVETEARS